MQVRILDREVLDWLLEGPAWINYAVELQLLDSEPDVRSVLQDNSILKLINRLKDSNVGIPALKTGLYRDRKSLLGSLSTGRYRTYHQRFETGK